MQPSYSSQAKTRFYNAGDRISETFPYSLPEGADGHVIGHWHFHALKESFFEVPRFILSQNQEIAVPFAQDIHRRFGERGIVLIDPTYRPEEEDPEKEPPPIAPSDELAVERGKQLWEAYTLKIAQNHLNDCEAARAAGGAPRAAVGFTRKCLKFHGITDPAQQYIEALKKGQNPGASNDRILEMVAAMQQQNQQMMALVLAMASGKKIDSELVAQLAPQASPAAAPSAPAPTTSGVATGKTAKHVEARDSAKRETGLEVYERVVKGKKDRAKAAVAAI